MRSSLVFATKLSSCSMIALTVFGFGCQAQAASITLGNTTGKWVNPIPDSQNQGCSGVSGKKCYVTGVGTDSFTWGEPKINTPPEQPNRVTFVGNTFPTTVDIGKWFRIGNLEYLNGIIYADTNIKSATLNLNLSLGDKNPVNKVLPLAFNFLNTPNINTQNLKAPENADYVELAPLQTSFIWNKQSYLLDIDRFKIGAIEGEYSTDNSNLYAKLSYAPSRPDGAPSKDVPEGPTVAGSLLTAIYLLYRKRFSKQKAKSACR
ncbi:PEP-CTERM sorting domain-containing protein [Tolypothrix sp. PCC 7910]|uniref:choice-of-anchor K domain-containing protein n=1 Tax=Tolypothrix sp. PCC 7910 TaxID=2099387 RepID=UPI0014278121|nr:choice-of-anchor K domain-containing protein [Tolypothrix sp. PCC 7910]QIR36495.1 PEP-CTERM sorting domain-containing protein [Tolypothrix sp. PCC 7910]